MMATACWVILCFIGVRFINAQQNLDFLCPETASKPKAKLPETLEKLDTYQLVLQYSSSISSDGKKLKEIEMVELRNFSQNGLVLSPASGGRSQWSFDFNTDPGSILHYHQGGPYECNVTKDFTGNPFDLNTTLLEGKVEELKGKWNWRSLRDALQLASNASKTAFNKNVSHEHGIPVDHFVGCYQQGEFTVQFLVCLTGDDFTTSVGGKEPVRVQLTMHETKEKKKIYEKIYEVFSVSKELTSSDMEEVLLPPKGVACTGLKPMNISELPPKFDVSIEYIDPKQMMIDTIQVAYDTGKAMVGFTAAHQDGDVGILHNFKIDTPGHYRVVHDFVYGFQYKMNDGGDKCVKVEPIPTNLGDVKSVTTPHGRTITIKDPTELLLGAVQLNFTLVGIRMTDDGVPAVVYVAEPKGETKNKKVIYEAWYSQNDWEITTAWTSNTNSSLLQLNTYHYDLTSSDAISETAQHFHSLADLESLAFPWEKMNADACLNITNQSYLYLVLQSADKKKPFSVSAVNSFGKERVESGLREAIASRANISSLRIASFFFKDVTDGVMVFFMIGEKNKEKGRETLLFKSELSLSEAVSTLNESLTGVDSAPILLKNFEGGSLKVEVVPESVRVIPAEFHPAGPPVPPAPAADTGSRYSGGSMAALGICMLLIGAALGVVLAFFMWKRNRGIAYQVYE